MPSLSTRAVRVVLSLACLLFPTATPSLASPAGQPDGQSAGQADGPARCHFIGKATKPAERLSSTQFMVSLDVDRSVGTDTRSPAAPPDGDVSILVNSTYGDSFFRPFDVKTGTALDVSGYVRAGGQCVVDTLNVGTLAPGYEGYLRPGDVCPTAGDETIAVADQATGALGCAVSPMFTAPTAIQHFQNGLMLNLKGIYALQTGSAAVDGKPIDGGTWSGTRNTWREGQPASAGLAPPGPSLQEPLLGFGKAWREDYGGPEGALGWAIEGEATVDASWQLFEGGIVIVTKPGEGLILYRDGQSWESKSR
jgi:hypothetical protein